MNVRALLLLVFVFLLSFTNAALAKCEGNELVIRFGVEDLSDENPRTRSIQLLQRLVNIEMQNKACVEVVADPKKFVDNTVVAELRNGAVQLAAPSFASLSGQYSSYSIFSLPFAFADQSAIDRFQRDPEVISNLSESLGAEVVLLGFWHGGFQQLSATILRGKS